MKTLQLEQMAVMGSSEEPSVVASRMRLVFSTLEVCGCSSTSVPDQCFIIATVMHIIVL